jgi:predicted glycoside hydrolase/deacetylase ChbG (UPF0249 family)
MRYLIVNADDFGQSPGVNRGIMEAHAHGIVTSASLMVRWPAATEAAAYARQHPEFSLGLHVDLAEWACRDGDWFALYKVVRADDAAAIAEETTRQLAAFRNLTGHDPTHVDSHQHIHREEPAHTVIAAVAQKLGVPLRHYDPRIQYCGSFYGQTPKGRPCPETLDVDNLIQIIRELPSGITELACHPGYASDLDAMYASERAKEVQTLCDPRVRQSLDEEGITLRSFRGIGENPGATS